MSARRKRISEWTYWSILVLAAAVALALGHWGFALHDPERSFWDNVYIDLQLFTMESGAVQGPVPVPLEVARFLAPVVAAAAVIRLLLLFLHEQIRQLRIRTLRGHMIVCGAGDVGYHIAVSAEAAGRAVVMVENASETAHIERWLSHGGLLVRGDATEPETLRRAGLGNARTIVAACGDDGANVNVALAARRALADMPALQPGAIACHVQVLDYELGALFRGSPLFVQTDGPLDMSVFNAYDATARIVSQAHPLDRERIAPDDARAPQLIVLGFGRMGMSLAVQYAKIAHYANAKPLQIEVFDRAATVREKALHARYPGLSRVCTVRFHERELEDAAAISAIRDLALRADVLPTIVVCLDGDSRSLACALAVQAALHGADVPVLARMASKEGLAALIDSPTTAQRLVPFGMLEQVCDWNALDTERIDRMAKEVHRLYTQKRTAEKSGAESTPPVWHKLDPELQNSCRQQADHIPVKLRTVGCAVGSDGGAAAVEFTPQEIELLARMEHRRWVAERVLSGWQSGPKDTARKITPYLVDYNELEETIKDYDRDTVRNLPKLVAMAGGTIRRAAI